MPDPEQPKFDPQSIISMPVPEPVHDRTGRGFVVDRLCPSNNLQVLGPCDSSGVLFLETRRASLDLARGNHLFKLDLLQATDGRSIVRGSLRSWDLVKAEFPPLVETGSGVPLVLTGAFTDEEGPAYDQTNDAIGLYLIDRGRVLPQFVKRTHQDTEDPDTLYYAAVPEPVSSMFSPRKGELVYLAKRYHQKRPGSLYEERFLVVLTDAHEHKEIRIPRAIHRGQLVAVSWDYKTPAMTCAFSAPGESAGERVYLTSVDGTFARITRSFDVPAPSQYSLHDETCRVLAVSLAQLGGIELSLGEYQSGMKLTRIRLEGSTSSTAAELSPSGERFLVITRDERVSEAGQKEIFKRLRVFEFQNPEIPVCDFELAGAFAVAKFESDACVTVYSEGLLRSLPESPTHIMGRMYLERLYLPPD